MVGGIEFRKYLKEVENLRGSLSFDIWLNLLLWGWLSEVLMIIGSGGVFMTIFLIIFERI